MDKSSLSSIIHESPTGIITFNIHGEVSAINNAAMHMLGLVKENYIGTSIEALEQEINQKCLQKLNYNSASDACLLIKTGKSPIIIKQIIRDNPSSFDTAKIFYLYDITHETNVSEMKTELLMTFAHELRNSLTSIHGHTELLLKHIEQPQSKELLGVILKHSIRINNMINDILDIGRANSEQIVELSTQKIEINTFVTEIAKDLFINPPVILKTSTRPIFIEADKEKITQALINIYSNAIKYSDKNRSIQIIVLLDIETNMVGIQVKDQGIGMTPAEQSQLFTRFYRANPDGHIVGTGLGLCLVKEILQLHAGGVEVQSQKGKGTQVTLWIPTVANSKL